MKKKENLKKFYERNELLESNYTDGVYNEYGELVIRPLTEEEEAFRKKFNSEFVLGKFENSNNLHDELIKSNEYKLKELKKERSKLRKTIRQLSRNSGYKRLSGKQKEIYRNDTVRINEILSLYEKLLEITKSIEELDIVGNIRNSNYASRRDFMSYKSFRDKYFDITQISTED